LRSCCFASTHLGETVCLVAHDSPRHVPCFLRREGHTPVVPKIVSVAAYKGGVGKTTLALELAYLLDAPLVDLDWDRGGASRRWGYRHEERAKAPLVDAVLQNKTPRLLRGRNKADLLPSHPEFATVQPDAEDMAVALGKWAGEWGRDVVVVDTHPGGVPSTFGAMFAASVVVVPVELAVGALDALDGMLDEAADYPLLIVPNKVPSVPPAPALRRLGELTSRWQVPVGPPIPNTAALPNRQQRMAVTALDPTPARLSRYVTQLRALAEAVRIYGS
jgi:chromosome partitioning protein